jgi:hypothetical protein
MKRVNEDHYCMDHHGPHNIDHMAYAEGTAQNEAAAALEVSDPFWQTLGGNIDDPWGDGGETLRQREKAIAMDIGLNIYAPMLSIVISKPPR